MTITKDFVALVKESGYALNEIISPRRQRHLVDARQAIAKGLRSKGYSFPAIAGVMRRDHTSIIHLVQRRNITKVPEEK
jgi:chromosomal replication initiation ATPase DnaA